MPKFNDSDNIIPLVPEGDYIWKVIQFEQGISSGGKTNGSTNYTAKLEIELPLKGQRGPHVYETLIDHDLTAWKIDTFLKSAGIKLARGMAYEFDREEAVKKNVPYVNPYGLRGWGRFIVDEYQGKKKNKVAVFYTDKEKLPRDESIKPPEPKPAEAEGVVEEDVPF